MPKIERYFVTATLRDAIEASPITMGQLCAVVGLRGDTLSHTLSNRTPIGASVAVRVIALAALVGLEPDAALKRVEDGQ